MSHNDAAPLPLNGFALASAIIGSLSLLVAWIPLINLTVVLPAIAGLVLGVMGLRRVGGRGMAIGGIVASGASLLLVVLALSFLGALIGAVAHG